MLLLSFFEIPNGEKLAKNVQKQYVQVIPRSTTSYNVEGNMNQEQMRDWFATLSEAVQIGNANHAVLTQMFQNLTQFFEQEAEPTRLFRQQQRGLKLDASSFPSFEDSGTEEEKMSAFIAWEKGVRTTLTVLGAVDRMPFPAIAAAIVASFHGSTLKKATTLNDPLRTLFCGAAMREKL